MDNNTISEEESPSSGTTKAQERDFVVRLIKLETSNREMTDEIAGLKRRVAEIQRGVDLLNDDRKLLETLQSRMTGLEETIKLNSQSVSDLYKRITEELRNMEESITSKLNLFETLLKNIKSGNKDQQEIKTRLHWLKKKANRILKGVNKK